MRAPPRPALLRVVLLLALASPALAHYDFSPWVLELDRASLEKLPHSDTVHLVEFYGPWCRHCKNLTPEYEKAAQALRGIVTVAASDAGAHKEAGSKFDVLGFPTIRLISTKPNGKLHSVDYKGQRDAASMVKWAVQQAGQIALERIAAIPSCGAGGSDGSGGSHEGSCGGGGGGGGRQAGSDGDGIGALYGAGSDVVTLTDANFHSKVTHSDDLFLVVFVEPWWCWHCKELKPVWEDAATSLKGKVKVAAMNCTANSATCQGLGVPEYSYKTGYYPTIKYFGTNKERPEPYSGGRREADIVDFATEKWRGPRPPPQVRQLTDQETFVEHCTGHAANETLGMEALAPQQLCFLAFLPYILGSSAAGRNAYLKLLTDVAVKFESRPFSYFWAQGAQQLAGDLTTTPYTRHFAQSAQQPALEASVGVGGYGYPAFVALNPQKLVYATLRGNFEPSPIMEFVGRLRQGMHVECVSPVVGQGLAEVVTVAAWDGLDAGRDELTAEEAEQEEMDKWHA